MTPTVKLKKVFESSCTLFINVGYLETKMKDIAKLSDISVGALYALFENKQALLDFIFTVTLDETQLDQIQNFPIREISTTQLLQNTKKAYEHSTEKLNQNLLNSNTAYDLAALTTDLFQVFKTYGRYFLILEKNPTLNPKFIHLYKQYRRALYQNVQTYLAKQHNLRSLAHPEYDAMLIVDLIFWWSTHKKYDGFENSKNNYSLTQMTETITELLVNGYQKS